LEVEGDVAPMPATAPEPRRSARLRSVHDVLLLDSDDPATYQDAMGSTDSESWFGAMRSEFKSMDDNLVWNLVDLPDGSRAVECKWVFKKKIVIDGNVYVYKARLIAKGFQQVQGVDYVETFSIIAMLKSVNVMLALAAYFDWEIWQMDVKMALLSGNLSKTLCSSMTDERDRMSKIPYASAIGSVMYVMMCNRPDVAYALSVTSRYPAYPGQNHWQQ
jgi:hypothetical protein